MDPLAAASRGREAVAVEGPPSCLSRQGTLNMGGDGVKGEDRRSDMRTRAYFEQMRADLAMRLRTVCAQLSDEEFRSLTEAMTRMRLKYEPFTAVADPVS